MLSINRLYFVIFLLMLLAGMYFNHVVTAFSFADEFLSWLLVGVALLVAVAKNLYSRFKSLWVLLAISGFYLFYSITVTQYNTTTAAISDLVVELKPFVAFFVTLSIAPQFTPKQKTWLRYISMALLLLMLMLYLIPGDFWEIVYFHPAYLGINSIILSMIYYYCSEGSKRDKIITVMMLSMGFCGARSKFYGFFVVAIFMLFIFKREMFNRLKIKYIIGGIFIILLMLLVAWQKINYYFIAGGEFSTDEISDSMARAALYVYTPEILADHPFFGTGFASYGTYFSAHPYSSLYGMYEMDKIWGLSETKPDFVADTYYPVMVQFGYVGVLLFIMFVRSVFKRIKRLSKTFKLSDKNIHIATLCMIFILIENIASAVFTQGGGVVAIMLCAIALGDVVKQNELEYAN